jgi:hypothetical protein
MRRYVQIHCPQHVLRVQLAALAFKRKFASIPMSFRIVYHG